MFKTLSQSLKNTKTNLISKLSNIFSEKKIIDENIISALGLEDLSAEKANEVVIQLEENIQRKIVVEILDLLNEVDQKKVSSLLAQEDGEAVSDFLSEKIPAHIMDPLIQATAESVVKEFKNSIK